jgi:hypothetical protein
MAGARGPAGKKGHFCYSGEEFCIFLRHILRPWRRGGGPFHNGAARAPPAFRFSFAFGVIRVVRSARGNGTRSETGWGRGRKTARVDGTARRKAQRVA